MAEETAAAEVAAPEAEAPASSWTDGMNESSQGFVENKGWKNPDQMLESYQNLEKTVGVPSDRVLHLPKEDDADGWGEVYNRMGRPEEPSGYKLNEVDVPDGGIDLTPNLREWAHEAGLSQDQTTKIYDKYNARLVELNNEVEAKKSEQATADEQSLRKEWGSAWDENISAGTRFRQRFGLDDATVDKLEDALGLRGLLELSAKIGRGLGEHGMPNGAEDSGDGLTFGMTPAAAKAKIGDLTLDKDFMSQYLEGNPEALARMTRLHSLAHPSEVASSK